MYILDKLVAKHADTSRARIAAIFDLLVIVAIALLVMLPRLLSPEFGLLDDGQMLRVAHKVLAGNYMFPVIVTQATGRFFPVYWYYFVPQYALWGDRPLGFYFVGFLSLTLTTLNLRWVIHRVSGSRRAGLVAACLFLLAPPIVENYYTLGKSEPILSLMLSLSVTCLIASARAGTPRRQALFATSLLLLPLAYLTKETALVMIPISIAWAIGFAWVNRGETEARSQVRLLMWYSVANLISGVGARLLAGLAGRSDIGAGGYTRSYRLDLDVVAHSLIGQLHLLARDYGFLVGLLPVLGLLVIWQRSVLTKDKLIWLLAAGAIWAAGWLGILLPWNNSVQEYYLLPASLGLCALGGIGAELLSRFWNTRRTDSAAPRPVYFAVAFCGLGAVGLVACQLVNFSSNGRLQLAIDRQNGAMIGALARKAPPGSTVLFNLRNTSEYVFEAEVFLKLIEERTDLQVGYVTTGSFSQRTGTTLVVMLHSDTPSGQTVRMAAAGTPQDTWNNALLTLIKPAATQFYHGAQRVSAVWVNANQWLCWTTSALQVKKSWLPSSRLCPDQPSFQRETIDYGWRIYAIPPTNIVPRGRTSIGVFEPATATWRLRSGIDDGATERTVWFGQPGDVPLVGDWDGDGLDGIGVFNPKSGVWSLDNDLDGRPDLEIRWSAMRAGDIPLVGDWNGDGVATIGFFRPRAVSWHLRNNNTDGAEDIIFRFGLPTDIPLAADWDGDGKDSVAIYRPSAGRVVPWNSRAPGALQVPPGGIPVATSWRRSAPAALSTFAQGQWSVRYIDCRCADPDPLAPVRITFGQSGDVPIAGGWYEP